MLSRKKRLSESTPCRVGTAAANIGGNLIREEESSRIRLDFS
jgi:hypothetical protein